MEGGDKLLYENIKKEAKQQGLSIFALEKRAGIGNGVISSWKQSSPTLDKLIAVANVLNVSISDLLNEQKKDAS